MIKKNKKIKNIVFLIFLILPLYFSITNAQIGAYSSINIEPTYFLGAEKKFSQDMNPNIKDNYQIKQGTSGDYNGDSITDFVMSYGNLSGKSVVYELLKVDKNPSYYT